MFQYPRLLSSPLQTRSLLHKGPLLFLLSASHVLKGLLMTLRQLMSSPPTCSLFLSDSSHLCLSLWQLVLPWNQPQMTFFFLPSFIETVTDQPVSDSWHEYLALKTKAPDDQIITVFVQQICRYINFPPCAIPAVNEGTLHSGELFFVFCLCIQICHWKSSLVPSIRQ